MWDGNHYRCTGCGELYSDNYKSCPCCHAPCVAEKDIEAPSAACSGEIDIGKYCVVKILWCERIGCSGTYSLMVTDGLSYIPVVCGLPNCREGLICILAPVGSLLPDCNTGEPRLVQKAMIHGEFSSGVICTPRDLAYPKGMASGAIELGNEIRLGESAANVQSMIDFRTGQRIAAPWDGRLKPTSQTVMQKPMEAKSASRVNFLSLLREKIHSSRVSNELRVPDSQMTEGRVVQRVTLNSQSLERPYVVVEHRRDSANPRLHWIKLRRDRGGAEFWGWKYDSGYSVGERVSADEFRSLSF